jgi:hypothetical protein
LIGAGYNPNKQNRYPTITSSLVFESISNGGGPSDSYIAGFEIGKLNIRRSNTTLPEVTNILIERNKITFLITGNQNNTYVGGVNNIRIRHNQIKNLNMIANIWAVSSPNNSTVTNNVIERLYGINSSTTLVKNNIIISMGGIIRGATFASNIFLGQYTANDPILFATNLGTARVANNTFNNNVVYVTTLFSANALEDYTPNDNLVNSFFESSTYQGTNGGGNNLMATDPQFEDFDNTILYQNLWENQFSDFRLAAGSPGIDAGTDGTDIGIYGGSTPWPDGGEPGSGFQLAPMPPIPQVTYLNIINAVIGAGDQLEVEIKANKGN